MFDADRPIQKSTQDRLGRTTFAKYLARCMLDHKDPESLVVGLYGGWGAGKTSVINLVVEELNFAATNLPDDEKPIILNFSPWSYSGQGQLIYSFFRRLSSALRSVDYLEDADEIIHLLELYVSFFTQKPIPKPLRRKHSLRETLSGHIGDDVYGWESGRDLTAVKNELNELLRKQKHKIIIIIDNISRLYDYEIKQIFQIVKSMGDYANTAYLLAIDKELVVEAINHIDGHGGDEYLEKIVQLPFDIPPILQNDIEKIFADRLGEIVKTVPVEAWNIEYWADIYYGSLKYFFVNCRDITRYINTVSFGYSRLRDVVNPVDFFALSAIEVFIPEVYSGIRENKDLFTDLLDNVYFLDKDQIQKDKLRCDEILERNKRIQPEILLDLMLRLFPRLRHIYHPDAAFYHSDAVAQKLKRICSPDVFDIYFRLSMQAGQIPESEFETILEIASDTEVFDQALTRLNQDDRINKFLDMLDSRVINTIPRRHIEAIICALLDNGDLFPQGNPGTLELDTPMRIHRIIHRLLRRLPTPEERFAVMQNAINHASKSLYVIVHELNQQSKEHKEESDTFQPLEFRDLSPEQLGDLRKLAVVQIEKWAEHGSLITHPQVLPILYAWLEWGNSEACRAYVEKVTKVDKNLVAFLCATLEQPINEAMTEYQKRPEWEVYLEDINDFITPNQLAAHSKQIFEDGYFEKLREREQLAVMIFLDLIKAPTKKIIPKTSV